MRNQYLEQGKKILEEGNKRPDRTGTGTLSLFGKTHLCFNLQEGYPLETSKFTSYRLVAEELLWFLSGSTNNNALVKKDVHIWSPWALVDKIELTPEQNRQQLVNELAQWVAFNNPSHNPQVDTLAPWTSFSDSSFDPQTIPVFETREELNQWIKEFRDNHEKVGFTQDDFPITIAGPKDGELGNTYGAMWRNWPTFSVTGPDGGVTDSIDQIAELVKGLREKPFSRRHIVTGWNPSFLPDESASHETNVRNGKQVLPPCHTLFQFYVRELPFDKGVRWLFINKPEVYNTINNKLLDEKSRGAIRSYKEFHQRTLHEFEITKSLWPMYLDCQLYQRSADFAIGVPFNIASYALLTHLVAHCVDMLPGEFIHSFGDAHIYGNHVEIFKEQLKRETHPFPTLKITAKHKDIFAFTMDEIELSDYTHSGKLDYPIAV